MTPRLSASVPAPGTTPTRHQDIGKTIRDAVQQAQQEAAQEARAASQELREAQQPVREAQQQLRDAQQQLRDAQQQLREATTDDQRGAADQAIFGAQQAVRAAERELRRVEGQTRSAPVVYTMQPPDFPRPMLPPGTVDIAIAFFVTCAVMVVGWPISRALGRRFERRGANPVVDARITDQLQSIEQAVEAVAIEVERISEGQRFLARLQEKSASTIE
jgi:multidrug efflux pump subunit AcrA (membrane-fusion protein)